MNTVNDFFCGAGGMGLGFKNAGFDITGAWDFDKYAVQSYKHNVGDHVLQADISEMGYKDVPKSDVWTFGFPCQDLSNAGKQAGMKLKCMSCEYEFAVEVGASISKCPECIEGNLKAASRSGLFFEVMRLIDETKENDPQNLPKIIMAENVKGLKKFLPVLKEEYNKRGYRMTFTIYNSKYWGVPQNRERYFVVGIREDLKRAFQFPRQQTDYVPKLSGVLETEVDEKYYIDVDKTKLIIKQAQRVLAVRQATKKGYAEAMPGDSINISHPNSQTRRGRVGKQVAQTLLTGQEQLVFEPTAEELQSVFTDKTGVAYCSDANYTKGTAPGDIEKGRHTQIVEEVAKNALEIAKNRRPNNEMAIKIMENGNLRPHKMDKRKSGINDMVIANDENVSYACISSHAGMVYGESTEFRIRKLTPREYARLQGFPDDYEQIVSNSQFYKQMGNAVTVNVAEAIANQIKLYLNGEPLIKKDYELAGIK